MPKDKGGGRRFDPDVRDDGLTGNSGRKGMSTKVWRLLSPRHVWKTLGWHMAGVGRGTGGEGQPRPLPRPCQEAEKEVYLETSPP